MTWILNPNGTLLFISGAAADFGDTPHYDYAVREFLERFKLTCKKCGSDNVVVDVEHTTGSDSYGPSHDDYVFGCNACKQNDFILGP